MWGINVSYVSRFTSYLSFNYVPLIFSFLKVPHNTVKSFGVPEFHMLRMSFIFNFSVSVNGLAHTNLFEYDIDQFHPPETVERIFGK